jgi:hypothetical protein
MFVAKLSFDAPAINANEINIAQAAVITLNGKSAVDAVFHSLAQDNAGGTLREMHAPWHASLTARHAHQEWQESAAFAAALWWHPLELV